MYIVGDSVKDEGKDVGRIWAWPPGWFENENVFLHLEHKYLLALLHAGAYEEFFEDFRNCLLPFQDLERVGRNPLENASFIVSSRHPRPAYHGRAFLPRSSGTTAEVLEMLLVMSFGKQPFRLESGELVLRFEPVLPGWLFAEQEAEVTFLLPDGTERREALPACSFSALFLSHTLVTYLNPGARKTYGDDGCDLASYALTYDDGRTVEIGGPAVPAPHARDIRDRAVRSITVHLA